MLNENDLARITARIVSRTAPLAVGVFGSYAIGSAHEGSDLDLFVIERGAGQSKARRQAMHRALFGVLYPMDILVYTAEEFEGNVYEHLSFEWVIVRQARLYYWTEEAPRLVPSLFVQSARAA
jgi:predicted nucleotidyltransferase